MNLNDLATQILQHQRSTPELIAEALRQAILHGIFAEGQSLRQDEIATKFGVSRIPVREALRQLEAEGLVKFHANRGAMVTRLSPTDAEEIIEIRMALESAALQRAIPNLTERNLQKAGEVLEAAEQVTDVNRWAELNWEFHATLYASADRPRLLSMIKTLHINLDRYVRLQLRQTDDLEVSQKEHRRLLTTCRDREVTAAVALLQQHISTAGGHLVDYLRRGAPKPPFLT